MKRFLLAGATVCLLVAAVAFSDNPSVPTSGLQVQVESRNPWTHLNLNNDSGEFRFAVVSDRTGGHRARVFSQAVEQLNLLQPEFVLSVGDLIEGYKKDEDAADQLAAEWKEFQGYVSQLHMPFFYVAGNHDISNALGEKVWKEKFGRPYYHFVYRNVLFLLLNADDPPGKSGGVGADQRAYFKRVLDENRAVRWTIVALHRPLWAHPNHSTSGWPEMEELLANRPYTVFAGHEHRYQKFVRQGRDYYQLATTGGGSRMRGVSYGEFDHFVWVTMKRNGPVLANLMLDGIYREDMSRPVTEEPGMTVTNRRAAHPAGGKVHFEGNPVSGALVTFYLMTGAKKPQRVADGLVEADGSFSVSSYAPHDGAPAGEHAVTVVWRKPFFDREGKPGPNWLPDRYAKPETSGLRVEVKPGRNDFKLELTKEVPAKKEAPAKK